MSRINGKNIVLYRNSDIKRIVTFIPKRHKHIRLLIETNRDIIVFQEAATAAIVRTYIDIKTHPINSAIELLGIKIEDRKAGYAEYQFLESNRREKEVIGEMSTLYKDEEK